VTPDEHFQHLRLEIIGRRITFVRLVCNMLLLYLDCEPGDGQGWTFWFNPPWHLSSPEGLITGSGQAEGARDDGPTEEELARVSGPICKKLLGRPITDIQVDRRTRDLTLTVAGIDDVRTFASDPEVDHLWHLRENTTGLTLYAANSGLSIH
jgi:hypothetical protein